jgi:hypothetical protein
VPRLRTAIPALVLLVAACGTAPSPPVAGSSAVAPSPTATALPSAAPSAGVTPTGAPRELRAGSEPLPPGRYTKTGFRPPITLELEDGWFAGTVSDGFFDVQQDKGTPDVIAVQLARVDRVIGAGASDTPATTAAAAVAAVHDNPGVAVIDESASRLGGLEGLNVIIENRGSAHAPVLAVSAGTLGIDPQRRLWISLFDTADGLLAVMVGGSVAAWERALDVAEPVLESVMIGAAVTSTSIRVKAGGAPIALAWISLPAAPSDS